MCSYEPPDPFIDSLLLLVLPPKFASDEMTWKLETQTFDTKPGYEALSYTWGNGSASKAIELNFADRLIAGLVATRVHLGLPIL